MLLVPGGTANLAVLGGNVPPSSQERTITPNSDFLPRRLGLARLGGLEGGNHYFEPSSARKPFIYKGPFFKRACSADSPHSHPGFFRYDPTSSCFCVDCRPHGLHAGDTVARDRKAIATTPYPFNSFHTRNASVAPHACASQPRCACGASPSMISGNWPRQP